MGSTPKPGRNSDHPGSGSGSGHILMRIDRRRREGAGHKLGSGSGLLDCQNQGRTAHTDSRYEFPEHSNTFSVIRLMDYTRGKLQHV